ncbi:hypothetical protein ABMY45_22085 [Pseudoalteromonas sp. XMcav11-Q]
MSYHKFTSQNLHTYAGFLHPTEHDVFFGKISGESAQHSIYLILSTATE